MHFRRQGTEDAQTKGCGDEDATKLTGHGQNLFQKSYSTDSPQIGLHTSSGHLEKEAWSTMSWCVNTNDTDFPLTNNKALTGSDLAT